MDKNAKIFVAGHRGMVGSAIVRRLQETGYNNLVLKTRQELDLLDQNAVRAFFEAEKPEYVVDAAAKVGGIKANMDHLAEFLYENTLIQNNIIWSAKETGVKKLLFLGSSCIYPRECPQPIKEDYLLTGSLEQTNEGYAIAKISGLKLCEYLYVQHGLKFISAMPTNLYGQNDNFDPESSHVLPGLMGRMHKAKLEDTPEFTVWGTGTPRREFLYVDDLADAAVWMLESYDNRQFLNVGTGEDITIRELAETLQRVIGYQGKLVFDTSKPDGTPRKLLDVSRLHDAGWKHKIIFEEGVKRTYDWYLENIVKGS